MPLLLLSIYLFICCLSDAPRVRYAPRFAKFRYARGVLGVALFAARLPQCVTRYGCLPYALPIVRGMRYFAVMPERWRWQDMPCGCARSIFLHAAALAVKSGEFFASHMLFFMLRVERADAFFFFLLLFAVKRVRCCFARCRHVHDGVFRERRTSRAPRPPFHDLSSPVDMREGALLMLHIIFRGFARRDFHYSIYF